MFVPCGIADKRVTSMEALLGRAVDRVREVADLVVGANGGGETCGGGCLRAAFAPRPVSQYSRAAEAAVLGMRNLRVATDADGRVEAFIENAFDERAQLIARPHELHVVEIGQRDSELRFEAQ